MSSLLFGNGTNIVHWKPNPNTRGTSDILSTCIITMLLCVWTAVHLNVSPPGSVWLPRLRKVRWLVLALLAPEMIAYTAWFQRRRALSIMREVNKAFALPDPPSWHESIAKGAKKAVTGFKGVFMPHDQEPVRQPTLEAQRPSSSEDRHPWTMVHGFYALMGGIAFEIPGNLPESQRFLPSQNSETWFVSDYCIHDLLSEEIGRDVIPNLSEEEIVSKSKANGLAKALVCIQAFWFIAQCLTRLIQRIPISLLELNTFGHAICALLVYFLWWEKPFAVDYPTMIQGQILRDIRSLTWMQNNQSSAAESFRGQLRDWLKSDQWFQTLSEEDKRSAFDWREREFDLIYLGDNLRFGQDIRNNETRLEQETGHEGDNDTGLTTLKPGQTLQGTVFKAPNLEDVVNSMQDDRVRESFGNYTGSHLPLPNIRLTNQDVNRWKMASRATPFWRRGVPFVTRCKNSHKIEEFEELPIILAFSAAAFIYGGLHALAWFAHFNSSTEQLLWRISACMVMGGPPIHFVFSTCLPQFDTSVAPDHEVLHWVIVVTLLLSLGPHILLFGAYVLARAYLVVECFINLSHLPAEVYDVPNWSTYFPHIS